MLTYLQCIGATCLDYGKGESLCLRCPPPDDDNDEYDDDYNDDNVEYYYDDEEDIKAAEKYTEQAAETVADSGDTSSHTLAP